MSNILKKFYSLGFESHQTVGPSIGLWKEEIELFLTLLDKAYDERVAADNYFCYTEVGTHAGGSAILAYLWLREKQKTNPNLAGRIDLIDIKFPPYFFLNMKRALSKELRKVAPGISTLLSDYYYCDEGITVLGHEKSSTDFNVNCLPMQNVVFIDGLHSYKQTFMEYNKFSPAIKRNGLILSHDHSPRIQKAKHHQEIAIFEINNRDWLENNTNEDFYVDESFVRFVNQGGYELLDCEIECYHPRETGILSWVRGTTSCSSALAAARKL